MAPMAQAAVTEMAASSRRDAFTTATLPPEG